MSSICKLMTMSNRNTETIARVGKRIDFHLEQNNIKSARKCFKVLFDLSQDRTELLECYYREGKLNEV